MISSPLEEHIHKTVSTLSSVGVEITGRKMLPYGVQLSLQKNGSSCKINLYYSKKKGNSVVRAGGDTNLLDLVTGETSVSAYPAQDVIPGLRAGSDEAGKGDYFGPLVVAAVLCDETVAKSLVSIGVGDSKKLSRARVRELYEKITEMNDLNYSVFSISPSDYNRSFDEFKRMGRNSLDILAMAHGKAIEELTAHRDGLSAVVIDKFCKLERLKNWLTVPLPKVELRVRAEDSEPAVAAASIIARSVYLNELEKLSSRFGVALKPGAGAFVDSTGRELVLLNGIGVLAKTAKIHFANTKRITEQDLTGELNL